MRTAGDIKRGLIELRFGRKKLPLAKIAQDAGCTPRHVIAAMKMEATEVIQRRLDAYLDAGHLHRYEKHTRLLWELEQMTRELVNEYHVRTLPMRDIQNLPPERQQRMKNAMSWRLKTLLREKWKAEHGSEIHFLDSQSYWTCKAKVLTREGKLAPDRKPHHRLWTRPMGKSGDLQSRKDQNRRNPRVLGGR
jgi:hypothetical protein